MNLETAKLLKKCFSGALILLLAIFVFSSCTKSSEPQKKAEAASASKTIIKIGIGTAKTHPNVMSVMEAFKPIVESESKGRFDVQVFASAQLGGDLQVADAVRNGTVDIMIGAASAVSGMVPELNVLDLPFLFEDTATVDKIMDGQLGRYLRDAYEPKGFKLLAWMENGFCNITNNKKEIHDPKDMKGLKIRVMENPIRLGTMKALGANPTPMSFTELFTSLQQGILDGQENPNTIIFTSKFNEVQKYLTISNHSYIAVNMIMNVDKFNKMSPEDQALFLKAGEENKKASRKLAREMNENFTKELEKVGMKITVLTPKEKADFKKAVYPVWDTFADKIGQKTLDLAKAEIKK